MVINLCCSPNFIDIIAKIILIVPGIKPIQDNKADNIALAKLIIENTSINVNCSFSLFIQVLYNNIR